MWVDGLVQHLSVLLLDVLCRCGWKLRLKLPCACACRCCYLHLVVVAGVAVGCSYMWFAMCLGFNFYVLVSWCGWVLVLVLALVLQLVLSAVVCWRCRM